MFTSRRSVIEWRRVTFNIYLNIEQNVKILDSSILLTWFINSSFTSNQNKTSYIIRTLFNKRYKFSFEKKIVTRGLFMNPIPALKISHQDLKNLANSLCKNKEDTTRWGMSTETVTAVLWNTQNSRKLRCWNEWALKRFVCIEYNDYNNRI